jgi:hypothetical protein
LGLSRATPPEGSGYGAVSVRGDAGF